MAESLAILIVLGCLVTAGAVAVYWTGWLILATPLVRWCLVAVVCFLACRVMLLPFTYLSVWWSGYPGTELDEEIRSKLAITLTTSVFPTPHSGHFTIQLQGWIGNHSSKSVESVDVWCRAEKLSFGDSETVSKTFAIAIRPGETKVFSGTVATDLTGVVQRGHYDLQPPEKTFCRVAEVRVADGS